MRLPHNGRRNRIAAEPKCCPLILCAFAIALGAGCERASVHGTVIDERGDLLPGVIVTVERSREQDLTDAMGEYHIGFRPRGAHTLLFHKTGFTPAILELDVDGPRSVDAKAVEMWRVPIGAGVYVFNEFQFEATTPVEATPFPIQNAGSLYGTQRDPEYATANLAPVIILYRVPTFDARLARIEEQLIAREDGKADEDGPKAWVLAEPVAADLVPIDEPEGLLHRLSYDAPLTPGVYAVHWGALHGSTATEGRIFMFRILAPDEEIPTETEPVKSEESVSADNGPEATVADDGGGF